MTVDEMNKILTKISSQTFQTKILNVVLTQYNEIKNLENLVIELQKKVNEIIDGWNDKESAAPVQQEEDAINNEMPQEVIEDVDKS